MAGAQQIISNDKQKLLGFLVSRNNQDNRLNVSCLNLITHFHILEHGRILDRNFDGTLGTTQGHGLRLRIDGNHIGHHANRLFDHASRLFARLGGNPVL